MWIYLARIGILILGGLWPITPCPPPLLGRRVVIAIMRPGSRGLDCRSFRFFHAPALTIGNNTGLLVGCSGVNLPSTDQVADHLVVGRGHDFHRIQPGSVNNGIVLAYVLDN